MLALENRTREDQRRKGEGEAAPISRTAIQPGVEQLPLDTVFDLLKNRRRRLALQYLRSSGGTATLSELAEQIASVENDTDVDELTSSERKRVYIGLYQCHLPKMDNADVIDFDGDRGAVELRPPADQLFPYLDIRHGDAGAGPSDVSDRVRAVASRVADLF